MNKKRKGPEFEDYYLIVFPDDEEGGKALDLLSEEGPVHGVLYEDQPCTVASESQLKRLTRAGIKWSYATGGDKHCEGGVQCHATLPITGNMKPSGGILILRSGAYSKG